MKKRVLELTLRMADGTATEAEVRELERLIEGDRQARRLHLEMMEIEAALRTAQLEQDDRPSLTGERTVQAVMENVRLASLPRPRRARQMGSRPIWIAAGVVAAAAAVALFLMPSGAQKRRAAPGAVGAGAPGTFARSRPQRADPHAVAAAGAAGWAAAPMRVRSMGPADVSRLELEGGVSLEVRGPGLVRALERPASGAGVSRLVVGDGTFSIEGTRAVLPQVQVVSPHAEVVVRARKALIAVAGDTTRIDMHDGTAVVRRLRDGASLDLGARQSVAVAADEPLVASRLRGLLYVQGRSLRRYPTDFLDGALVRHLEGLGFAVEVADEAELEVTQLVSKALVMISPSTSSTLADRLEELGLGSAGVPVVCSQPALFADLDLTDPMDGGGSFAGNATRLEIVTPAHPLSAGLTGPVQVTRAPGNIGWGRPGPDAVRVASFPDLRKSTQATIFAYERGAPMIGPAHAPARRVGFFIHPDIGPYITEAGWALLDAAVRWAADDESL